MAPRPPSSEELLDLAWMLDAALMRRQRNRALQAAERLVDRLISHDEVMAVHRRQLDPETAVALADGSLLVLAEAVQVLERLRRATVRAPALLRFQLERLIDDEATAMAGAAMHPTGAT